MTTNQKYDLTKKVLYLIYRVLILGVLCFLAYHNQKLIAVLVFLMDDPIYEVVSQGIYERVRRKKIIKKPNGS